jgi:hypothetical protein
MHRAGRSRGTGHAQLELASGQGNNAEKHGLKRLNISNPYDAPPGAIIVVKGPGDAFYNDGNMGYGGRQNFPPGNSYVLGVYVPA